MDNRSRQVAHAVEQLMQGKAADALPILVACVASSPRDEEARFWSAVCKLKLRRFAEAVRDFDAAIDINPQRSNSWLFRGEAKRGMWLLDEAWTDLERALELCPFHVPAYELRADICLVRSDWDGAIKEYTKGLECEPENAQEQLLIGPVSAGLGRRSNVRLKAPLTGRIFTAGSAHKLILCKCCAEAPGAYCPGPVAICAHCSLLTCPRRRNRRSRKSRSMAANCVSSRVITGVRSGCCVA